MPHPDLHELLRLTLPFVRQQLEKRGGFYPFGASVTTGGQIEFEAAEVESEQPAPDELLGVLIAALRRRARGQQIRAAAVCFDVRVRPPGRSDVVDAACARLEHVNGEAIDAFLPYRKGGRPGDVTYDEMFTKPGERVVFATDDVR